MITKKMYLHNVILHRSANLLPIRKHHGIALPDSGVRLVTNFAPDLLESIVDGQTIEAQHVLW